MFTSDTNKPARSPDMRKTMFVYLAVSLFCVFFERVYAHFGHGVFSPSMSFLFLYPLLGGVLPAFLLWFVSPRGAELCRFSFNCYNSGIAALTIQSLLLGIFEIAGTNSPYLVFFAAAGWAMILLGIGSQAVITSRQSRSRPGPFGPGR